MTAERDPWFPYVRAAGEGAMRLFCFPYAGAGAAAFRTWRARLPANVEIWAAQPPGRETRLREAPLTRVEALADAIVPHMRAHLDRPYALVGHSLGALIACEVARRLEAERAPAPMQLIVSGARAPHLALAGRRRSEMTDEAFVAELERMNGTRREVLEQRELMALLLPMLRADFAASENYQAREIAPLAVSITAICGELDDEAPYVRMEPWRAWTRGEFRIVVIRGDHFFIHKEEEDFLAALRGALDGGVG